MQKIWIKSKRSSDAELIAGRKQKKLCTRYIWCEKVVDGINLFMLKYFTKSRIW